MTLISKEVILTIKINAYLTGHSLIAHTIYISIRKYFCFGSYPIHLSLGLNVTHSIS